MPLTAQTNKSNFSFKNKISCFLRIWLLLSIIPNLSALNIPFHTENELDEYAMMEEPLETETLIRLFLYTSDTDPEKYPVYMERIRREIEELKSYINTMQTGENAAPAGDLILQFLHQESLVRYSENQTRLDTLLDTGVYNCVSSAVYYMIFCRALGIEVKGIHAADHAFCSVTVPGQEISVDVETTNKWGYNPGTKKAFHSEFTESTGFIYVPPGRYSNRVELGDREMAGLILQNRIVLHQRRGEYESALELAADRLALTGTDQAGKDYFDSIQNLAAMYNQTQQYEKAVDLINLAETGPFELPDFLDETRYQVIYNLCSTILNAGDPDQAERVVIAYSAQLPEHIEKDLLLLIEERRLDKLIRSGYSLETVQKITDSRDKGILTSKRAEEMLVYLYAREAENISLEENFLTSLEFLDTVPVFLESNRDFIRLRSVYENNYAVEVHNSVIPLLENEDWEGAKDVLNRALEKIPRNRILLQDLQRLESF